MDFKKQFARRRLTLLMDAISIIAALSLAWITHDALRNRLDFLKDPPPIHQYLLVGALTMPLMLSIVSALGLHRPFERTFSVSQAFWDQVRLHAASLLGIAAIIFVTQIYLNRSVVGVLLFYTFCLMLGTRIVLDSLRRRAHAAGHGRSHLLIVGDNTSLVEKVIDSARAEDLPPQFVGVIASDRIFPVPDIAFVPVLGGLECLRRVLHEETVDEVVLATRGLTDQQFSSVLSACDDLGTPMRQVVLPEFKDGRRLTLERQYGMPFVTLERTERSVEALALKRGIDLAGSLLALVLLFPVMLAIALAILAMTGRPILFSQERIGYRGRRFHMYKFRSMRNGAETQRDVLGTLNEMDGPVFKIARDPRVTPLGRFLRKYSLDELPQLFNVLSGTMSLVGPRPLPVAEQQQISGQMRRRLSMKPGCTGLWQVSGRSNLSFDEWMKMDLQYLDTWSNVLDLKLLILTIPAVFLGRGAK